MYYDTVYTSSGDCNFDFDSGFQADAGLSGIISASQDMGQDKPPNTDYLFDDLTGSVQVDQALVNLELITIPGLGTLTTRLCEKRMSVDAIHAYGQRQGNSRSYGW
jgi:hypothetical protein